MKKESVLINWDIINNGEWYQLRGQVINDVRFENGEMVRTSMIERIDFVSGKAETKNTIYYLK